MECPEMEGWWGDLMTGGCNEISHKYTLADTLANTKSCMGKTLGAWVDRLRNLHDKYVVVD